MKQKTRLSVNKITDIWPAKEVCKHKGIGVNILALLQFFS